MTTVERYVTDSDLKRLALEILARAIRDLKSLNDEIRISAEQWIEEKSDVFGGFYWCLDVSRINPNFVRDIIKKVITTDMTLDRIAHESRPESERLVSKRRKEQRRQKKLAFEAIGAKGGEKCQK